MVLRAEKRTRVVPVDSLQRPAVPRLLHPLPVLRVNVVRGLRRSTRQSEVKRSYNTHPAALALLP